MPKMDGTDIDECGDGHTIEHILEGFPNPDRNTVFTCE
jgi:hypothetical protein